MTVPIRRRSLCLAALAGSGMALAACADRSGGGSGAPAPDLDRIAADATAILAALSAVLGVPAVAVLLGADAAAALAALAAAQAALAAIEALAAGPGAAGTTGTRSAGALSQVTVLLGNAQIVLELVQGVANRLGGALAVETGRRIAAVRVLVPFVQRAAGFAAARAIRPDMDEAAARRIALAGTGSGR